ncbi:MAG: hypothetical protein D4R68_01115 [Ignavibacteriales bacterium]|nr:MAG: hypothetical protein D4R68_01115 [Ignavibacteriales bacterium]
MKIIEIEKEKLIMQGSNSEVNFSRTNLCDVLTRLIVDLPAQYGIPKSQILLDASVDLAKYHPGGSQPGITSLIRVCDYLELCPGVVTLVACWVNQRIITYPQALHILSNWTNYEHLLNGFQHGMIKLLDKNPKLDHSTAPNNGTRKK